MIRTTARNRAAEYFKSGFAPVPIPFREKGPIIQDWRNYRLSSPDDFPNQRGNVGIILGQASGGLICVDLDDQDAVELATDHLPPTGMIAGRSQVPRNHWYYRVIGEFKKVEFKHRATNQKFIEILGDGQQVVVGPSVHPSGDVYDDLDGEPATIEPEQLIAATKNLYEAVCRKKGLDPNEGQRNHQNGQSNGHHRTESRSDDLRNIDAALDALSPSLPHDDWVKVAQAIHDYDSSLCYLWDQWSQGSDKYKPGECERKWKSFTRGGGITIATLFRMADDTGKKWRPERTRTNGHHHNGTGEPSATSHENECHLVRNFELVEVAGKDDKPKFLPKPTSIERIAKEISARTENWPRNVGGQLFYHDKHRDRIFWLPDSDAMFSYLGKATGTPPDIKQAAGFHTKREIFSHLQRQTTGYDAVEELPHEPLLPNHYYACGIPPAGDGDKLRSLVNRFSPETEIDRDLILAAFVTPFWGSAGGNRPAFCITAPDRGAGKSTIVRFAAELAGGFLDISSNEDIGTLKARLLSAEAATRRIVWFDNIKTSKLSWAELESLITSPSISGKKMYVGEWQRPNTFTYFMTMNGASYSRDMAQRTVIIRLRVPEYSGEWEAETQRFIEQNRQSLIADIIGFLRGPAIELERFSRWGDWERAIVSRLPEPSEAQAIIRERQNTVDADNEESMMIEDFFADRLTELGYDVTDDRIFIPSVIACQWLCAALNDRLTSTKATQMLKQRIENNSFRQLTNCPNRNHGRGFEFWGSESTGQTPMQRDIEHQIEIRKDRF